MIEYYGVAIGYFNNKIDSFKEKYNPSDLMKKIAEAAKKTGASGVYYALLLYYALSNESIPMKERLIVMAALGYYISPLDFIPDFMIAGYLDDASVLMYVFNRVSGYIDDEVRSKAKAKLRDWFGEQEIIEIMPGKQVAPLSLLTDQKDDEDVTEVTETIISTETIVSTETTENKKSGMYAFVSFEEMSAYIEGHYGKEVSFGRVSDKEVRIVLTQKTIIKNIHVGVNVRVEEVKGDSLTIAYNGGCALNMIVPSALSFVMGKIPELKEGITTEESKRIHIDLSKIEKAKKIVDNLALEDITAEETGLKVAVRLK